MQNSSKRLLAGSLFAMLLVYQVFSLSLPASHSMPEDARNLSLEENVKHNHNSATRINGKNLTTEELSSMNVNLNDLESYFNQFREKKTKLGDEYWKVAKKKAMVGPVQVLDNIKHEDFDFVTNFDEIDISGFFDMMDAVFKDENALQKGKKSKKAEKAVTSSIDVLDKFNENQKFEESIPSILNLLTTMLDDSSLFQIFSQSGGFDNIFKLQSAANPEIQKMAQGFVVNFKIDSNGDFIFNLS